MGHQELNENAAKPIPGSWRSKRAAKKTLTERPNGEAKNGRGGEI